MSAIGLQCIGMSDSYGPADRDESIATVRFALDEGIILLDTANYYGVGSRSDAIAPLVGARRHDRLAESVGASDLVLDDGDLARIESAVPTGEVLGDRYDAAGKAVLDSEG